MGSHHTQRQGLQSSLQPTSFFNNNTAPRERGAATSRPGERPLKLSCCHPRWPDRRLCQPSLWVSLWPQRAEPRWGHTGRPPREAETSCDISGTVLTRLSLIIRQALHISSTENSLFKKILGDFWPLVQPRRSLEMVTHLSNREKLTNCNRNISSQV